MADIGQFLLVRPLKAFILLNSYNSHFGLNMADIGRSLQVTLTQSDNKFE